MSVAVAIAGPKEREIERFEARLDNEPLLADSVFAAAGEGIQFPTSVEELPGSEAAHLQKA